VVLDFATVTGRDASEAVRTLGQAINNPTSSMGRLTQAGISLDQATKDQIKSLQAHGQLVEAQTLLLNMLEKSYGGAAAAARDTFGGALIGLKNDAADLLEGNGGGLRGMTDAVKQLDDALKSPDVKEGIQSLITGLMSLVTVLTQVTAGFAHIGTNIGEAFARMRGYAGGFDDQIHDLTGHIQQTKDAIANLIGGGEPKDSPEITQLQHQLRNYEYQLKNLKLYQDSVTGKSPAAGASGPALPSLANLDPLALKADVSIGKMPDINDFGVTGQKASPYDQMLADQQKVTEIWKQNDPAKALQEQIDKTRALVGTVANGEMFTADDANKHIEDLKANFQKNTDQMTTFANQAARNIQDAFAKGLFDGFHNGLRGMTEGFTQMLAKMLDQLLAAQLLDHFFGSADASGKGSGEAGLSAVISKGLDSFFGGGKASGGGKAGGGDVMAGNYYQVAENGPELYNDGSGNSFLLPSANGSITPNGALGGGNSTNVHIDARGAGPDETAKLLAMRAGLENSLRGQVEHRLRRGGWPSGRKS
jgi:hypothetical protein